MIRKTLPLFALLFSVHAEAQTLTYYDCEAYLRKGIGNDFIVPFQLFLERDYIDTNLGEYFNGDYLSLVFTQRDEISPDDYQMTMQGPSGQINPLAPQEFKFKKFQPFKFEEFWEDHGWIRITCNPKTW
ncbi:hypothetical protein K2X30_04775 [bacterium]|jgi:hypothetical protein|nr:hypothetical protein [bacterium]